MSRRTFFTSDTHFNHGNIIKYCHRPFMTKEEEQLLAEHANFRVSEETVRRMDAELISQINETVGKDDILWHLGDFCFARGKRYYDICRSYRDQIRCKTVNLVWGNHDHKPKLATCGFDEAHDLVQIRVNHQKIVLCHYPMLSWEGSGKGAFQLYGHCHTNLEPWADDHMPGRKSLDVGVDNALNLLGAMRPFSFEEVRDLLSDRSGFSADHHYDQGHWEAFRKNVGPDKSLADA